MQIQDFIGMSAPLTIEDLEIIDLVMHRLVANIDDQEECIEICDNYMWSMNI